MSVAPISTVPDDGRFETLENSKSQLGKDLWMGKVLAHPPNVLDPDDALMKKFQDALQSHLLRCDNRLSKEIQDLESAIKVAEKERETRGLELYYAQEEISKQQKAIEKYQSALAKVISLRQEKDQNLDSAKEQHRNAQNDLLREKQKEDKLSYELKKLTALQNQVVEWETELNSSLAISQQISEKDAVVQRELLQQKQQKDYILYKLSEEVWKVEAEIVNLDAQLQSQDKEKIAISQMVSDANADLVALHKEHMNLCNIWNSLVLDIGKRNKVYDKLIEERDKIREVLNTLQAEGERIKKDTNKEMETNENLTSLHSRVNESIQSVTRVTIADSERMNNIESELIKVAKFYERTQSEYNNICAEQQFLLNEEEQINKELAKLINKRNELENIIFTKLEDKVICDKTAQYLNKILINSKDVMQVQELLLTQTENSYGRNLLELERLNSAISNEKLDLQEIKDRNIEKEREINDVRKEIKKCEVAAERKQNKIISLNKMIEEILLSTGGEEIDPQKLKMISLEKSIHEIEQNNQKAQQFWMRQQNFMVNLSQQRDLQLQELNLLNKEIMIMEQKNLKLEYALDNLKTEEANTNKTINLLQQKLVQLNVNLALQKELKDELRDKNCITKNEYVKSLQDAELNLANLENDIKDLHSEKIYLKEQLNEAQRESLSWEKKVQLIQETAKKLKDERSSAGDIGLMKSEIHKMEMRLAHLRRAQEKLIHDMEFCVARRDVILDKAISKLNRNAKGQRNEKTTFRKRLNNQKLKTKQIKQEARQTEAKIQKLKAEYQSMLKQLDEQRSELKVIEDGLPDINKEIDKVESIKYHNLQALVHKQRKVKLLQDVKNNRYKMLFKNEIVINEEFKNERILNDYLKHVMERTHQDFPLLKNNIRNILLTLQM